MEEMPNPLGTKPNRIFVRYGRNLESMVKQQVFFHRDRKFVLMQFWSDAGYEGAKLTPLQFIKTLYQIAKEIRGA